MPDGQTFTDVQPIQQSFTNVTPIGEQAQPEGFWSSIGHTLSGFLHPSAQNPYPGMGIEEKVRAQQVSQAQNLQRKEEGRSLAYRVAAPLAQSVGADVPGMEQAARSGDTSGVFGHAVGSAVPAVAALGLHAAGEALPSAERAGASLQDLKSTVGNVPVNTAKFGDTALELYTQSQRGAVLPSAVRKLVVRVTTPDSPPMTYAELKDFQSNISSLSANEKMNLKPNTARLVGQLNQDLKSALTDAADTQGKGQQFQNAMREYHNAMRIRGFSDAAIDGAIKFALGGIGLLGAKKIYDASGI